MQFTLRDRYACNADRFWREVFFEEAYNTPLYRDALRFEAFDLLSLTLDDAGNRQRRVRVKPRLDAPAAVRKVIGDSLTYIEEGRFDAAAQRWHARTLPSVRADKISIVTEMWMEPVNDHEADRVARFDVNVSMFGVGRLFEKFVEKTLRDSYDRSAEFTNRWLATRWGAPEG